MLRRQKWLLRVYGQSCNRCCIIFVKSSLVMSCSKGTLSIFCSNSFTDTCLTRLLSCNMTFPATLLVSSRSFCADASCTFVLSTSCFIVSTSWSCWLLDSLMSICASVTSFSSVVKRFMLCMTCDDNLMVCGCCSSIACLFISFYL